MSLSRDVLIGRAHELAPVLAERALRTEHNRALLDESLRDLIDSGLLATLTPKVYGGHEQSIATMSQIVRILSAGCPSTGWVATFYMGAAWRLLSFPLAAQREIYAKPYVLSAGQAAPLREATRVPGGVRISGQTPWGSGSTHAEWVLFMGVIKEDNGERVPLSFIVPRHEVTVVDNWHVAGMQGTASNDMRVDDVFVPEHRIAPFASMLNGTSEGQRLHPNPMYHLPLIPFLMCEVIPVMVGALRGAAEAFVVRTRERRGTLNGVKAASKQAAQMRLARGLAAAEAAEVLLNDFVTRYEAGGADAIDLATRAGMKLKAAYIADLCRNAVNDLARGFGGDGFRDHSPLQRYFRDLNMLAVHAFLDIDTAAETLGRVTLGLPPEDPLL